MYLLGVSGGVDSMYLLEQYKDKKIIVAHINYNQRSSAKRDEIIVKKYCDKYNVPLFVLQAKEKPRGNFQSQARKIRYDFFHKIYKENKCTRLLLGHHKDDFIETVLMQKESNRDPFYYGIKKNIKIYNMEVERPFVDKLFKLQIEKRITAPYGVDETNFSSSYTRNLIRKKISSWSTIEKEKFIKIINKENIHHQKIENEVKKTYKKINTKKFLLTDLRKIQSNKHELLFYIINQKFSDIKISKNKINSLWNFIEGSEGNKIFKINDSNLVVKKDKKLFFKTND